MKRYSLEGLRACLEDARRIINNETISVEKICISQKGYTVYFDGGFREGGLMEINILAETHIKEHHPRGLMLDAKEVLNSII